MQALATAACRIRKRTRMQFLRSLVAESGRACCVLAPMYKQASFWRALACCPAGPQEAQADHERPRYA
jgi:hypothetical protein